jgi:hypothetical protein
MIRCVVKGVMACLATVNTLDRAVADCRVHGGCWRGGSRVVSGGVRTSANMATDRISADLAARVAGDVTKPVATGTLSKGWSGLKGACEDTCAEGSQRGL